MLSIRPYAISPTAIHAGHFACWYLNQAGMRAERWIVLSQLPRITLS
ncbi:MAG: hypothetical protein ACI8PT_001953 [Gammaproteobacteria bacterium]|jgi:hypothetical protein